MNSHRQPLQVAFTRRGDGLQQGVQSSGGVRLGVSRGEFFAYFPDRLLQALAANRFEQIANRVRFKRGDGVLKSRYESYRHSK
ncbi:MAG: hypothetical protein ACREAM_13710 [Blastocatellia bacterium]